MTDPVPTVLTLGVLALLAVLLLGVQVASIARDSDTWVIARGMARGKVARLRRHVQGVRRG